MQVTSSIYWNKAVQVITTLVASTLLPHRKYIIHRHYCHYGNITKLNQTHHTRPRWTLNKTTTFHVRCLMAVLRYRVRSRHLLGLTGFRWTDTGQARLPDDHVKFMNVIEPSSEVRVIECKASCFSKLSAILRPHSSAEINSYKGLTQ